MIVGLLPAGTATTVRSRSRQQRRLLVVTLLTAVLALSLLAAGALVAQEGAGASDEDLVARLAELEQQLQGVALLPDVTVAPETTWGTITGDFVGARVILTDADDELAALVEDAGGGADGVADAVETVASAYRTMREGYAYLAAFEQAGLGVDPVGDGDDPAVTSATDDPRGQAEVGLVLLLEALSGLHDGYAVLRDADAAGDERALFESRFTSVQAASQAEVSDIRTAISFPAAHLLVPVSRFTPRFDGENPAQIVRYLCADRDDYLALRATGSPVADLPIPEGDQPDLPINDCPDLDNGNEVRLVGAAG